MEQAMIDEGLKKLYETHPELDMELAGYFEKDSSTLVIECYANDSRKMLDSHLDLFHDVLYYIPVKTNGNRYRFLLFTFQDRNDTQEDPEHTVAIETSLELLPDTGGVTEAGWNAYTGQLLYTIDGTPCQMPSPSGFLDE
ncbi:MAG: hypothetical protein RDV48_17245 [Candidatus Eremiobacteraeota bacterium]|nr:hypothetical protein [Candidatus Eremiobacteraeota bacterium]